MISSNIRKLFLIIKLKINKISKSKIIKITINKKNCNEYVLWIVPVVINPASRGPNFHFSAVSKKNKKFIKTIVTMITKSKNKKNKTFIILKNKQRK